MSKRKQYEENGWKKIVHSDVNEHHGVVLQSYNLYGHTRPAKDFRNHLLVYRH